MGMQVAGGGQPSWEAGPGVRGQQEPFPSPGLARAMPAAHGYCSSGVPRQAVGDRNSLWGHHLGGTRALGQGTPGPSTVNHTTLCFLNTSLSIAAIKKFIMKFLKRPLNRQRCF